MLCISTKTTNSWLLHSFEQIPSYKIHCLIRLVVTQKVPSYKHFVEKNAVLVLVRVSCVVYCVKMLIVWKKRKLKVLKKLEGNSIIIITCYKGTEKNSWTFTIQFVCKEFDRERTENRVYMWYVQNISVTFE